MKRVDKVQRKVAPRGNGQQELGGEQKRLPSFGPEVNINLQIHISADASPDQIEQIFVSMSKHLYKNG